MPGLEHGRGARQVERDHALVGVPRVDHPVDVGVAGGHLEGAEAVRPGGPQRGEGPIDLSLAPVAIDHGAGSSRVRPAGAGRIVLAVGRVLGVAEDEGHLARRSRFEHQCGLQRPDRLPAMRDGAGHPAGLHGHGPVPAPVRPEEGLPRRLEPGHRRRAREPGEVVAALAVLRHVVDHAVLDVDLAGREVALEVRGVVLGVPEAELHGAEDREPRRVRPLVGHPRPPDLERLPGRHEVGALGADAAARPRDDRVPEAVTAAVGVELALGRLPARVPVVAGVVVADVQEAAAHVERGVVVAVPDQPSQPGVAEERVPAGGVGDEREVVLAPEVVDPRQRRVRAGDLVFPLLVVEVAVAQPRSPSSG